MATKLQAIRYAARLQLNEPVARFWSDEELFGILLSGLRDMWRAMVDLHQEHFMTVDITNVSMAANTSTLATVPADVFRVLSIEPRDMSSTATMGNVLFRPLDYQHPGFVAARASAAVSTPSEIYYAVAGAGSPVAAPTIHVAPQISSALTLRLVYIPTLSTTLTANSNNPIPGESDNALIAYIVAFALAKERENHDPDPNWLSIYKTEKDSVLVVSTPRQEQEESYVEGMFDGNYGGSY